MNCNITRTDRIEFYISIAFLMVGGVMFGSGLPIIYCLLPVVCSIRRFIVCTINESWAIIVEDGILSIKEPMRKMFTISLSEISYFAEKNNKIFIVSKGKIAYVYEDEEPELLMNILTSNFVEERSCINTQE